jgi:ABC-type glycerol-3-phosphate transport system substrate-binding protein
MKKLLSVLLAVLTIIFMLTACSNSSTTSPTNAPTTAAPASAPATGDNATAAPAEKVQLKLGIYPADTDAAAITAMEGVITRFNATHPNVEVVPDYYKYATDNFIPMAAAGNLPTIFESWFTEPQKLIRSGYVKDVTAQLQARGWADKINPSIKALLSDKDGHIYGIPRDGYALGLMCNVELFEKAGLVNSDGTLQYPKTWDELAATAKTIKDKTGAAGLCLLAKDAAGGWHWSNIAWAFGAQLVKDNGDGTYTSNLNSPEAIAAMEYTKSLKWTYDVLTADPTNEDWGTGFTQLGTGAAAMYMGANDAVMQPTANNGLPVDKLALVPVPAGPGGQYSLSGGTPYMFAGNATDAQIDAALDFLIAFGKAPVLDDSTKASMEAQDQNNVDKGIPNIPRFPCWTSPEIQQAENDILGKYKNVNMTLYNDYYAAVSKAGNLHTEEPGDTQAMYAEITKVLQAVLTDKNADVTALMNTANTNYQNILIDEKIGK